MSANVLLRFVMAWVVGQWVACPRLEAADTTTGRRLAVVIGVNTYRPNSGLGSLQHAVKDASRLSVVLQKSGFTVIEMTHDVAREPGKELYAPNLEFIRDQISGVLDFPNLGAKDSVLITLHGHGVHFDLFEKVKQNGKTVEQRTAKFFFCPADATVQQIRTANELTDKNHLLPLDELYQSLGTCKAATKLLIVDACRNDPNQSNGFREGDSQSLTMPKLPPPPGGMAAFLSCRENQRAIEDQELGQGVFTHFLVQGLEGKADQPLEGEPADGIVTLSELATYTANNTYAYVFRKHKGVKQSPEIKGEFDANLPLVELSARPVVTQIDPFSGKVAGDRKELVPTMNFRWCPPGKFTMGSPESELTIGDQRPQNENQVEVVLTSGFWLGETEVTQEQWKSVMETTPWENQNYVKTGAKFPATYISHGDFDVPTLELDSASDFCRKLTIIEQIDERLPMNWKYVLPTEAQWEYACRAGSKSKFSFGDDENQFDDYGWYGKNAWNVEEKFAHEVGLKRPNAWGLCDMHGNVWEWCSDWYDEKLTGGADPKGAITGTRRAFRGGDWDGLAAGCRSAIRNGSSPLNRNCDQGFRIAAIRVQEPSTVKE